ncbi:protein-glutamine glutaminase family protein [Bdellovibrio sp. HCB290]|uniref:protein-glutamine glutaminase family protein n=1 Tax=Bdellovibrio sp. HCB290 TaxID=3394356 RepID=UPI0039B4898C
MKMVAIFICFLMSAGAIAQAGLPAQRFVNESFQDAKARSRGTTNILSTHSITPSGNLPESLSVPLHDLQISQIPSAGNFKNLNSNFQFIRDSFFMKDGDSHPRRLTWLYPDDGCYARAELAAEKLIEFKKSAPKKVYAFGQLRAKTDNAPYGWVEWWYHVAVTYQVDGVAYVLDPALNPYQPMTLAQWGQAIGDNDGSVRYSICSKDTFDPDDACNNPNPVNEDFAANEQRDFFPFEWERLIELGRNPEKELGNQPPWNRP